MSIKLGLLLKQLHDNNTFIIKTAKSNTNNKANAAKNITTDVNTISK